MMFAVLALVVAALIVGVLLGLALADVRAIRNRTDVGWQHIGADEEWAAFLHAINHQPRHAIEAGVT